MYLFRKKCNNLDIKITFNSMSVLLMNEIGLLGNNRLTASYCQTIYLHWEDIAIVRESNSLLGWCISTIIFLKLRQLLYETKPQPLLILQTCFRTFTILFVLSIILPYDKYLSLTNIRMTWTICIGLIHNGCCIMFLFVVL